MGCKFFRIYFIEVKCLNRQSTAMSTLFPHSKVSSQETIQHTYQYLKIEKNMHYLFTGVNQKSPTAEQE